MIEYSHVNPNYPGARAILLLCVFSGTEQPIDLRPVCKLQLVCSCPAGKKRIPVYLWWSKDKKEELCCFPPKNADFTKLCHGYKAKYLFF